MESLVPAHEFHTGLLVCADLDRFAEDKKMLLTESPFLRELSRVGLLENMSLEYPKLKFRYKNNQVKRALSKAGNILELYVYLVAIIMQNLMLI